MAATNEVLAAAIEMHRTGRLAAAQPLYQAVLAQESENADALHLLGVLHHQQGDHKKAVELISRAVALRPGAFAFHANLAEAYRAQAQFDRAIGCCRMALSLAPDYPEALCNLGAALQGLGKQAEAIEHFRRALELHPDFAVAHNNLGIALRETGEAEEAARPFSPRRRTRSRLCSGTDQPRPDSARSWRRRSGARALPGGRTLAARTWRPCTTTWAMRCARSSGYVDARAAYLEALRIDPNLAMAHAHLGLTLQQDNESSDALQWLKKAIELEPGNATFWEYLAEAYDEAEEPGAVDSLLAARSGIGRRACRPAPFAGMGTARGRTDPRSGRALPRRGAFAARGGHAADEPGRRLRRARQIARGRGGASRRDPAAAAIRLAPCAPGDTVARKMLGGGSGRARRTHRRREDRQRAAGPHAVRHGPRA